MRQLPRATLEDATVMEEPVEHRGDGSGVSSGVGVVGIPVQIGG